MNENNQPQSQQAAPKYSDGIDHSHLESNTDEFHEFDGCVFCGSQNVTIRNEMDICHDCGYVYK